MLKQDHLSDVPELTFRGLRGEIDYPLVLEITQSRRRADLIPGSIR